MDFRSFLKENIAQRKPIFFDGAMGSMIQKLPLPFVIPEDLNMTCPKSIRSIHRQYMKAGSNIICANTFGLNPQKKTSSPYSWQDLFVNGIKIAKEAIQEASSPCFLAWDSGQIGRLMKPMGDLTFDIAYEAYKEVAILAQNEGADLAIMETFSDLYEMKAAILAIRENTTLPVIASMTFSSNLRTLTGADVLTVATYLDALSPDVLGFNCGGSIKDDETLSKEFASFSQTPLIVQANAGLPTKENDKTIYKLSPKDFACFGQKCVKQGFGIIGGCCGTTPSHILCLVEKTKNMTIGKRKVKNRCLICTGQATVEIGGEKGPVMIGERINPTGKKKCKEALLTRNKEFIIEEAQSQIKAGAAILDVNTGLPGTDETLLMLDVTKTLQETFPDIPLQIDTSDPKVLEAALKYHNGKPLINSTNAKKDAMDAVFPLAKKYGGVVVGLCIDEKGIPPLAKDRVRLAKKILKTAETYCIEKKNIAIDTLTLTVSSEQETALETLKAIQMLKKEYAKEGLQFILGVSNISFGLPKRPLVNSCFLAMALHSGLSAAIMNPLSFEMVSTFRSFVALKGFDKNCLEYIDYANSLPLLQTAKNEATSFASPKENETQQAKKDASKMLFQDAKKKELIDIIQNGFKEKAASLTQELLKTYTPSQVIDECIVTALDLVGKDFESGKKFLPQLLLSADTVGQAFCVIKEHLEATKSTQETKGKILLATVEGDIHDIGKNIVKAMLENYGYTVLDMGKNVPAKDIVEAIQKEGIRLVGLSALMTTTVSSMQKTIELIDKTINKDKKNCLVMAGGAVLTQEYAKKIGADFYAKDATASVKIAKEVFGK